MKVYEIQNHLPVPHVSGDNGTFYGLFTETCIADPAAKKNSPPCVLL